jgi:hypothetical protein
MTDGPLSDFAYLARHLRERRMGASLRGLETTVDGILVPEKGRLLLRISGTGEVVTLAPLKRKVQ